MLKKLLSLLGLGSGRKRAMLMVTVVAGRRACGALRALDADGRDLLGAPVPVAARADDALASSHGNPGHDALRPYGDPACGTYQLIAIDRLAGAPEVLRDELGDCQLLFEPSEGDAAAPKRAGACCSACTAGAWAPTTSSARPRAACACATTTWKSCCAQWPAFPSGSLEFARRRRGCLRRR
jgi:hypothetical protein